MRPRVLAPLLYCFFLLSMTAVSQEVRITASVDSTVYQIGEWIYTRLEVTAPQDAKLLFPQSDDDIENGEFISIDEESIETEGATQHISYNMILTVFDTGDVAVTILLRYHLPNDTTTFTARSNTLDLTIATVALDTSITFKDIRDVMHVSLTIRDYLLYLSIIVILALLVWYIYRRRKRRPEAVIEEVVKSEPEIPAHIEALTALKRLEQDAPWLHDEHKQAQSRLSEILRRFIERRFRYPALEQTTGEIMRDAVRHGVDQELLTELGQTLRMADLAKFARYKPSFPEHENGVRFARHFVNCNTTDEIQSVPEITEGDV